jgi:hypothetical protein
MKRWMFALTALLISLCVAPTVNADWVPCINPNGTVGHWFDPTDPMPPPAPRGYTNVFKMYSYEYGREIWYAYPTK